MNDYAGLTGGRLAGTGIRDLPPLVQLLRSGKLVEVVAKWHFTVFAVWVVHMGNRYLTRPARVFKKFATQMAPKLFRRYRLETNVARVALYGLSTY